MKVLTNMKEIPCMSAVCQLVSGVLQLSDTLRPFYAASLMLMLQFCCKKKHADLLLR